MKQKHHAMKIQQFASKHQQHSNEQLLQPNEILRHTKKQFH